MWIEAEVYAIKLVDGKIELDDSRSRMAVLNLETGMYYALIGQYTYAGRVGSNIARGVLLVQSFAQIRSRLLATNAHQPGGVQRAEPVFRSNVDHGEQ